MARKTVLIIEDQPRWEYRYLANYLQRDQRVKLQTILLRGYVYGKGAGEAVFVDFNDRPQFEATYTRGIITIPEMREVSAMVFQYGSAPGRAS